MALVVKDRVRQTSITSGTGAVTLSGTVSGFQSFSVIGNGNTTYYCIVDPATGDWEVGIGTYTSATTSLSRDTVLESSNSNNLVNFGAGTKDVFCTYPADRSITSDAPNTFTDNQIISVNSTGNALRITQTGTGNALVVEDSTNPDATPLVVDTNGRLTVGYTNSVAPVAGLASGVSGHSTASQGNYISSFQWSADTLQAFFTLSKSRGATPGTQGAVVNGDTIGTVLWAGSDGTSFIQAARIEAAVDGAPSTNAMPGRLVFSTTASGASSPTERMRIDSAGNVSFSLGGTVAGQRVRLAGNLTGATSAFGFIQVGTVQSDVTSTFVTYRSEARTAAAAFTLPNYWHFHAAQLSIGAGSAITTQIGYLADSSMTGATNNYGFYSDLASGTGRWNFFANGTAPNVFAGLTIIGGQVNSESLRVTPVASAVNYINVQGNITGNAPAFYAQGNDTNIGLNFASKGNLGFGFFTAGGSTPQFSVAHTASAVNYVQATGAATGALPGLYAAGSDTNISLGYRTKGSGAHFFYSDDGSNVQFSVQRTASAVNFLQVTGAATGAGPTLLSTGSDTNVSFAYNTKGTGSHFFYTGNSLQFVAAHTASAVNYVQVTGAAAGVRPLISMQGSDTNIGVNITSKGTGDIIFTGGTAAYQLFKVAGAASAVNNLQAESATTGAAPALSAQGSDTNIDLALTPKGTGRVKFGTHTGTADTAISGYIEILDSAGNVRKLAVIT